MTISWVPSSGQYDVAMNNEYCVTYVLYLTQSASVHSCVNIVVRAFHCLHSLLMTANDLHHTHSGCSLASQTYFCVIEVWFAELALMYSSNMAPMLNLCTNLFQGGMQAVQART